jgi:hypothetical protein
MSQFGFTADPDPAPDEGPDPDPGFWYPKTVQFYSIKNTIFYQKFNYIYPSASEKDVKSTVEAVRHQKRISSSSKYQISPFFQFLWVSFWLPSWTRIQPAKINVDPDPQRCL